MDKVAEAHAKSFELLFIGTILISIIQIVQLRFDQVAHD